MGSTSSKQEKEYRKDIETIKKTKNYLKLLNYSIKYPDDRKIMELIDQQMKLLRF